MKNLSLKDWHFELPADAEAIFLERPNRFLARVLWEGKVLEVHVHDPGRLPQVLFAGNRVLLKKAARPDRRTQWDLLAGMAGGSWVFSHSGYHRRLTQMFLAEIGSKVFPGLVSFRAEPRLPDGRLDYLLEMASGPPVYVEVKGCTLADGERALFPDAPTIRGQRHLNSLISLKRKGFRALLWILVFRPETVCFAPAKGIDPRFASVFQKALKEGVEVVIHQFGYDGKKISFLKELYLCP